MAAKLLPSQHLLLKLFSYDAATGTLKWRERPKWMFFRSVPHYRHRQWITWNKNNCGKAAGVVDYNGYAIVKVFGKIFKQHRVIWKMVYGVDPVCIDHINHVTHDNRLANLRNVTVSQNLLNLSPQKRSKTGVRGVFWHRANKKWVAKITVNGQTTFLGTFTIFQDAVRARREAEKTHHVICPLGENLGQT